MQVGVRVGAITDQHGIRLQHGRHDVPVQIQRDADGRAGRQDVAQPGDDLRLRIGRILHHHGAVECEQQAV